MQDFRLYVILDVDVCDSAGVFLNIAREVISGGADAVQLRAKFCSDRRIIQLGTIIKNLTDRRKTLFILNDRADLASAVNADGVHLGQEDLPLRYARKILKKNKIIGISTHNLTEAKEAQAQGADYIGVGPIFPTPFKPKSVALTPKILSRVKTQVKIPFVALGGVNLDNLSQIRRAGGGAVAVCRAVLTAKNPLIATREFKKRLYS